MSYCTPCPPCDTNFPLLCEPLEVTTQAKRLVVEDTAACQKTLQTPTSSQQILKSVGGNLSWTSGGNNSLLTKDTNGFIELRNGSVSEPITLPNVAQHTASSVPSQLVMLSDGTVKVWNPTSIGNNYIAYWDGGDWRINTINTLLPAGNGSVFIRDNSGNLQAITGNANDILKMVGSTPAFVTSGAASAFPAGHLYGMILSNNITNPNTSIDISAGECRDSSSSENIVLSSSITKSVSGPFTSGTGQDGMLGGTPVPGPNATLHVLAIYGASGVDVGFNANPTIALASLPSGYDQAYRRIGSIVTNAAGAIEPFFQNGDRFLLKTPSKQRSAAVTTTGTLITLSRTPLGVRVCPIIRYSPGASGPFHTIYDPDQGPTMTPLIWNPTAAQFISWVYWGTYSVVGSQNAENVFTNVNGQIGFLVSSNTTVNIDVWGWIDQRNRLQS